LLQLASGELAEDQLGDRSAANSVTLT